MLLGRHAHRVGLQKHTSKAVVSRPKPTMRLASSLRSRQVSIWSLGDRIYKYHVTSDEVSIDSNLIVSFMDWCKQTVATSIQVFVSMKNF